MSRADRDGLKIFCGRASRGLAESICRYLDLPLGQGHTDMFPDGEIIVKVEEDVRGRDCFIVQSTYHPVNAHLMELLRLRPSGPQGRRPRAHHRQAGGQPDADRRC
jgi:ribose-phosphate pyrophosphokinase